MVRLPPQLTSVSWPHGKAALVLVPSLRRHPPPLSSEGIGIGIGMELELHFHLDTGNFILSSNSSDKRMQELRTEVTGNAGLAAALEKSNQNTQQCFDFMNSNISFSQKQFPSAKQAFA